MINPFKFIQYTLDYGRWNVISQEFYKIIIEHVNKSDEILEMGSSTGHINFRMRQNGYKVNCLDIRKEPIEIAKGKFQKAGFNDVKFYIEDIFDHKKKYNFIWNSGLIQCGDADFQKRMIEHLSKITNKLLLFYSDVGGTKLPNENMNAFPGVGDAKEYLVDDVPIFFHDNFDTVKTGKIFGENAKLSFNMLWCCGQKA